MEKTTNPKSLGFSLIWLKSVSLAWDWLDLTILWLKEVIWADLRVHHSMQSWEFHPPLSPPHVSAHLDEFWWMLQSTGWGVSQISPLIDSCTQWDSDLAQLDTYQALMDSPSAIVVYLLGICTPLGWISFFCINKAQAASSKIVRVGLRSCYHCNISIFFIMN